MEPNLNTITVTLEDGRQIRCAAGTPVCEILPQRRAPDGLDYIAALVNNDAVSVTYPVEVDSKSHAADAGRFGRLSNLPAFRLFFVGQGDQGIISRRSFRD